ncbi:MAG: glycosyltransferase [Patescibacteria group bacterium]|nr:glycosyltransferase [Patescibacteria group bacterium]
MTLSIVIPTKNEETCLPQLFSSIKLQSLQPDQVIIADAQSDDETRCVAEQFGAIIVNGGMPGEGRNLGAAVATSELILFLDADVVLEDKQLLQKAVGEFEQKNLDIATADILPIAGNLYDQFSHEVYNLYVRLWGKTHPHAPGFFILVKRSLHKQINGFDETVVFAEDHDYVRRAGKVGKFGFLDSVKISVSVRRQDRDGRLSMGVKYVLAELHILFIGPIRHNKFNYTFGHPKKDYAGEE